MIYLGFNGEASLITKETNRMETFHLKDEYVIQQSLFSLQSLEKLIEWKQNNEKHS
jgi:hypothetical protein